MVLVVVFVAIGESFSRHYKGLIISRLPALSAKATDSLYDISVQDIRINIFTRAVTVHGLRMAVNLDVLQRRRAEGRPPHVVLDVTVPVAQVGGVQWSELAAERSLGCRSVKFIRPEIRVQIMPEWETKDTLRAFSSPPTIDRVHAKRISIEEPQFDVRYSYGDDGFSVQTTGGSISAHDWDFRPRHDFDTTRFFAAREAEISLTGATYTYPGSLYQYAMRGIEFSTRRSAGAIRGLSIRPAMSYEAMYDVIGHRKDIYECALPSVQIEGLDWRALLARHTFFAERLDLDSADLSIYLSKRPPVADSVRPGYYPHQWLKRMRLPLTVRSINVWDGAVRYSEMNGKTGATGTLEFSYLRGGIYNVSNRPEDIARSPTCRAMMSGKFMHRTDMATIVDLDLAGEKGGFQLNGRVQRLDASQIRGPVAAMAIADVTSLHIPDARIHIAGDEDSTWGRFAVRYNDLKVKLNKFDDHDSDIHSRIFLSFLANKLLLYNHNPMPGEPVRTVTTGVARGEIRSFFNMIWKNIFQACTRTAIRDEGAYDIVKRKAANKGKPKRRFFKGLFPKRPR